ncbi:hypothetical protein JQS43_22855 [Natronosporangium hydrolyticum]|uniref:Uncharacterized protein n=1 Tax=Natronosporangium hydrolyticum TaxID=2811111 RepID=A0A895YFR4_9ACTN|nr:hypothetical protein [Natronosporangium hydrolyticum]QSB14309.1 hypothetical protein JQS43_22855 [Natronosporangium hydrolyticum]
MQPSLFGVEATEPTPGDLAGLLAGPGQLQQMGGTARVWVRVDAGWRVHVLIGELARRGLAASWAPVDELAGGPAHERAEDERAEYERAEQELVHEPAEGPAGPSSAFEVRTAYTTRLWALAQRWRGGPPAGLHLDGQALRLWVAAAGSPAADGYLLGLPGGRPAGGPATEAALRALGLPTTLVPGPAYRVDGRRRLALLAELVGDPPPIAPADQWPVPPS